MLTKAEEEKVMAKLGVVKTQLPKIKANDPAAAALGAKEGEVLEIARTDPTGEYNYYRRVIKGEK